MGDTGYTRSWAEVAQAWQQDEGFRDEYTRRLAEHPHDAFAWETVPSSATTSQRSFEDVIVHSPALARVSPDPAPFQARFAAAIDGICTFQNLGGDARLIAPAPLVADDCYTHLATFVRRAPREQVHALWREVGRAVAEHWQSSSDVIWVSTAGLGVHWLHVRLDRRPKYYRHAPFRHV